MSAYQPQPGTIPHRALEWLRAMDSLYPGKEYPTPELCEALDVETTGFTAFMATLRSHGMVHARFQRGQGKLLFWRLGDGKPVGDIRARFQDEPLKPAPVQVDLTNVRGSVFDVLYEVPDFRALPWEGKLLVTGMEIVDGVAVFTPDQLWQLKQHTDWMQPPAAVAQRDGA